MTNDYLNSSFLGKESKISDQRNDYTRSMKVIKLHSIKIRAKADTKWQLRNLRHKTCREREEKKTTEDYESFSGRGDSFHSNKASCSLNVKDPILNALLVIQMQK